MRVGVCVCVGGCGWVWVHERERESKLSKNNGAASFAKMLEVINISRVLTSSLLHARRNVN